MTAYPVKSALLRYPDGREVILLLVCLRQPKDGEGGEYVWLTANGRQWEQGTTYDEEARAMKQLRVQIETGPEFVGVNLTIKPNLPPPERRIASKIITRYALPPKALDDLQEIVGRDSNLSPLIDAAESLLANILLLREAHRIAFGSPLPSAQGLTLDALLAAFLEELGKSKGQDFSKLIKRLSDPPSMIVVPSMEHKGPVQ